MRHGNADPAANGWAMGKNKPTARKPCRGYPSQALYTNRENGLVELQQLQRSGTTGTSRFLRSGAIEEIRTGTETSIGSRASGRLFLFAR